MADVALQRRNMVESQVRPSDVTDRRIMAAMTAIPREKFLPGPLASLAYSDEFLTIAPGRETLPPRVLAKLIQLAELEAGDNVLVISEAGYAAALVAQMADKVVSLFADNEAVKTAKEAYASLAIGNVTVVSGAAASGWAAAAPYDLVLIEGGIEKVPRAIEDQIRENGRLVSISLNDKIGRAVVLHKRAGLFARRDAFQAAAPLVSGFAEARPAFVF
ncbi:protein-L-isoaspartate O-methyltransferase [Hyphomicrobium sp.]|uniref:protein-L-isoaspartate O-methyltransferase family protein n=1 Tax=Hyphomicrobium sp. TaxID=82 RepID=UPI000FB2B3EA|nr:protein-L-isoaspartate O-methyltransferase [Hyphomicrobium sp.]RUP10247.1 MAG: protein-L-isoaspartate O-methyltransferase [Hyphomicrobium sp.]